MNNLAHGLTLLCRHNKDGAYATQANRRKGLKSIANDLYALGYKIEDPRSIKPKHVEALVSHWHQKNLSPATIKNRMGWVRWWAEKVNKASIIPRDNADLGIEPRKAANDNRAWSLNKNTPLACPYAQASLMLIQAFGLRVEEALKIKPVKADRKVYIKLEGSWTKGGRPRELPISKSDQKAALDFAKKVAGNGALIPDDKSFKEQRNVFEYQTLKHGMRNLHGLRHAFAQQRYFELTGWKAPKAGGPEQHRLVPSEKNLDRWARKIISEELGHSRINITKIYLG